MARSWRSQIADEVRATSLMTPKWNPCFCTDCEVETVAWASGENKGRCADCGSGRTVPREPK